MDLGGTPFLLRRAGPFALRRVVRDDGDVPPLVSVVPPVVGDPQSSPAPVWPRVGEVGDCCVDGGCRGEGNALDRSEKEPEKPEEDISV